MERLTFDGDFCDIAQCLEIRGGEHCQDGYCSQRRVWERLKAYEDTGLTPELLARLFDEKAILELAGQALGVSPGRLRELAQAEKDGRLLVLPCKVGSTLYGERNLVAISIKHTEWKWKFGMPCVLWGHRTRGGEKRAFGVYTIYPNHAEVYSLEDWQSSDYGNSIMKIDEPVHMCVNFCKKYRKYDTVLVPVEEYIWYCKCACLPLDMPKDEIE